ncbi:MBL fold metallo-hydrolase [Cohaesibacter haloalkalitolerans]|uniref:MBL fold metallo-hydrolase n=1 Tax=Cohaesibacter haloalkalitolerans TaxID=1162980 RepID=UPI000E6531CC|nr:MBL fold metallo-hydrolase [Cohaesibacter haloalkalitolerans]
MAELQFDRNFTPHYGEAITLADNVRRVTCNNPSPFTFHGTNSYIVGQGTVVIIDPGPANPDHIDALLRATSGETISHILITHTHADHSPGARLLKARCGAPIFAEGPHRPTRALHAQEINALDAEGDVELDIDHVLRDGELIEGDSWALEVVHTPGHTVNHLAFAFTDGCGLFCGDHVMAWSTSIVAPPDGSMAAYMTSLDRLMQRNDRVYWPGHGGVISNPQPFLAGLKAHRERREQALVAHLEAGHQTIADMVASIYRDVDPSLHGAAALSMFAQMEYLVARGVVRCLDVEPTLNARYHLTGQR